MVAGTSALAHTVQIDGEKEAENINDLLWLPEEDLPVFAANLRLNGVDPTKRYSLRCVTSLYDFQGIPTLKCRAE